ncbi:hypothetical protein UCRPC4_g05446 [Phaeomoniella chlamydospora]|uniref:Uncharacterized protein n=1 Tax=Phaeomoniella chlamydospora TaxID=158046 RepID=A0A0G2E3J2_PHACM|nr:hypothetical protein UCRPC4_g05446 [Phaeomoniella chlamydospora]
MKSEVQQISSSVDGRNPRQVNRNQLQVNIRTSISNASPPAATQPSKMTSLSRSPCVPMGTTLPSSLLPESIFELPSTSVLSQPYTFLPPNHLNPCMIRVLLPSPTPFLGSPYLLHPELNYAIQLRLSFGHKSKPSIALVFSVCKDRDERLSIWVKKVDRDTVTATGEQDHDDNTNENPGPSTERIEYEMRHVKDIEFWRWVVIWDGLGELPSTTATTDRYLGPRIPFAKASLTPPEPSTDPSFSARPPRTINLTLHLLCPRIFNVPQYRSARPNLTPELSDLMARVLDSRVSGTELKLEVVVNLGIGGSIVDRFGYDGEERLGILHDMAATDEEKAKKAKEIVRWFNCVFGEGSQDDGDNDDDDDQTVMLDHQIRCRPVGQKSSRQASSSSRQQEPQQQQQEREQEREREQ